MRVFVAGGSGVVGLPLVEALLKRGHEVTASARRPEKLASVAALGARPMVMDGMDDAAVRRTILEAQPEVVVNQMTALAAPADDYGTWLAVTNRLRSEGTKTLMSAARDAGTRRVVAQSASFMTRPDAESADESSPPYVNGPGPIGTHARANIAAEELVLTTPGIEGVVLRYGFFYGAGTALGPGGDLATAVAAGQVPIVGAGSGRYPFVHVRDATSATVQAVEMGDPGIYNIVDDEPAPQAEWLPYLAALLSGPPPQHMAEEEAAERFGIQTVYYGNQLPAASNAKAKAELGLTLEYPSWREGFRQVFA